MPKFSKPLQSIRFFAAVLIFLHHWSARAYDPQLLACCSQVFFTFSSTVTFFFIASGWSLTYGYYEKFKNHTVNLKVYFQKRLLRLYPLHWIAFVITLAAFGDWPIKANNAILTANFLLVHAFIPSPFYTLSVNAVSWFLSVLLFWYLVFPPIMHTLPKIEWWLRRYAVALILLFVAGLAVWSKTLLPSEQTQYLLYFSPFTRLVDFLTGVLIYFATLKMQRKVGMKRLNWTLVEAASIALVVAAYGFSPSVPGNYLSDVYFIVPWALVIGVFTVSHGLFSQALSWKPFVRLGSVSYEFFLLHYAMLILVAVYLQRIVPMSSVQIGIIAFVATVGLSFMTHHLLIKLNSIVLNPTAPIRRTG